MDAIAITGATGYIGKYLVSELLRIGYNRVKLLIKSDRTNFFQEGLEVFHGDLRDRKSLQGFLEPGCTVVNLAYHKFAGASDNLGMSSNLLDACQEILPKRLIHCSSIEVFGRVSGNLITESAKCAPLTEYSKTKLAIEKAVVKASNGYFDAAILRPAAVFGPGSDNLQKLTNDLTAGRRTKNYLKSCLFGARRMNLVHIDNVISAILFLINRKEKFHGEIFTVSDADVPENNFSDVERILMHELGIADYMAPRFPIPSSILTSLLRCIGKESINPRSDYSPEKLMGLGYKKVVEFEDGLIDYASQYHSSQATRGKIHNTSLPIKVVH